MKTFLQLSSPRMRGPKKYFLAPSSVAFAAQLVGESNNNVESLPGESGVRTST